MCWVNHAIPIPAYLISARVESFAPPAICTRILQNYRELQLTDEQIRQLLDISREYHDQNITMATTFANLTADLDLVEARPNLEQKRRLLDEHAKVFHDHENLLLQAYDQIQDVLSGRQAREAAEIYEREKMSLIDRVLPGLRKAIGPKYGVARKWKSSKRK